MRTREGLIEALRRHRAHDEHEELMRARLLAFVEAHADCFSRSLLIGHVTGSAWVVDHERTHALLTHHAKLDKWLQMGGHCDGETDVLKVALREVEEESGLAQVRPLLGGAIFDVDAHDIPARASEPAHVHYDVRFAFEADRDAPLRISGESKDLAWAPLERIAELNTDESVMRLVEKTALLLNSGGAAGS
jgi:8-oxo-dGTP pyrophosphatase MutT (NUDIX family)